MGTYLSTPVTDKCQESAEDFDCRPFPVTWAVVDMQGWRKSMEDAHIARTRVPLLLQDDTPSSIDGTAIPADTAKVFGVFDGHGGAEVARFCQLYLVSVLTQQPAYQQAVHSMLNPSATDEGSEKVIQEVSLSPKETDMGKALINTFHALDRMIDDPDRREELLRLRTAKPSAGSYLDVPASSPAAAAAVKKKDATSTADGTVSDEKDDDSEKATGHEEAAESHQDMLDDNDGDGDKASDENMTGDADQASVEAQKTTGSDLVSPAASETMTEMIQRLLNLNPSAESGQVVMQLGNESIPAQAQVDAKADAEPSDFCASIVRNGRPTCNLADHPVHAGATAVVTVILGNQLTVANAGDSRAILCRCGAAYPLTADHKPLQDRELTRIRNAGGFVNHFGRVNGNLNLSRSIGDLKYKQVPGISPAEQMITAEPDIVQVTLSADDDFLVLGCDGIFDCLTNEQCIEYVRTRINEKAPTEIGIEMLNEIISDDPRASQGIGGDNMTIMVVDLKPLSRPYRQSRI